MEIIPNVMVRHHKPQRIPCASGRGTGKGKASAVLCSYRWNSFKSVPDARLTEPIETQMRPFRICANTHMPTTIVFSQL
jgi:hypothetical protein